MERAGLVWIVVILLAIIVASGFYLIGGGVYRGDIDGKVEVVDFESCIEAGYPVMESYPRQCSTSEGVIFVEEFDERVYCNNESRQGEVCIALYMPVCGWFNENINCIRVPCASTYSNSCFACIDENVEYYTEGECEG